MIDKNLYNIISKGIDSEVSNEGDSVISDLSLSSDNEITFWTNSGEMYKIFIEKQEI